MDGPRRDACNRWLQHLGEWAGSYERRPAAVACEVVRGIVSVDSAEYAAAVYWAGGEPSVADWGTALVMYGTEWSGPYRPERDRAAELEEAARRRDVAAVRGLR